MALINCPECGREISDKAASCPHCGAPIAAEAPASKVKAKASGREPDGVSRSSRSGGKWEAAGFLMIVAAIIIGMTQALGVATVGVATLIGMVGFVVFLVGRFK